ncbi:MAG: hydantoinase B/oxoprolinase family protein [Chloroflexi bacterium]|nr:hydantoinase B/oxoprolinase family protein [Chloroflexota bacterium]
MTTTDIDRITLGVVWGGLLSIADEAGITLRRTAYSQAVREGRDFSAALFDHRGRMIAQGDFSPGHLGSMPSAVRNAVAYFPPDTLQPGDAILLNDAHMGSGHLPDFFLTTPIFYRGELIAFAVNCAHHIDVGGAVPGSQAVEGVHESYQEGFRVLPVKGFVGGEPVADIHRIIAANVRVPDVVLGDLRAQRNANRVAERRIGELADRYGLDTLRACWEHILDHSEREMRAAIREIPGGVYHAEDYFDDCGRDTGPIKLCVTITVDGDDATIDYGGTDPQTRSGINATMNYTLAYSYFTMKCVTLQNRLPHNEGCLRPIRVFAPPGSVLNAQPPCASGARAIMQQRIVDLLLQAFAQALPDRVIAPSAHWANPIFGGQSPRTGRRFIYYEIIVGGSGARPHKDGAEAMCTSFNLENIPCEVSEAHFPVLIEQLAFVPDSGGAGRFRGGCALRKDVRMLGEDQRLTNLAERQRFQPPGLFGGRPGALGRTLRSPGTPGEEVLHSKGHYDIATADVVSFQTSGTGGYGDPLVRDPAAVQRDVVCGYVSLEAAQREYGVVLDPQTLAVDEAATARRRAELRAAGGEGTPPRCPLV